MECGDYKNLQGKAEQLPFFQQFLLNMNISAEQLELTPPSKTNEPKWKSRVRVAYNRIKHIISCAYSSPPKILKLSKHDLPVYVYSADAQTTSKEKMDFINDLLNKSKQSSKEREEGDDGQNESSDEFVNDFLQEIRINYHALTPKQLYQIREGKFAPFLKQRQMKVKDIKRILRDVGRYLLVCQVYFDDAIYQRELNGTIELLQTKHPQQLRYLRSVFERENYFISLLFPNRLDIILQKLLRVKHFPATKLKVEQQKKFYQQLEKQREYIKQQEIQIKEQHRSQQEILEDIGNEYNL